MLLIRMIEKVTMMTVMVMIITMVITLEINAKGRIQCDDYESHGKLAVQWR